MRITITLDDDVYDAAVYRARASGQRLGKVLSILARRGLARESRRFPVFRVPARTPMIAASRIQRIINRGGAF